MHLLSRTLAASCVLALARAADLTGNWVVSTPNGDGTSTNIYFDLHDDNGRLNGHIRNRSAYYTLVDGSVSSPAITLIATRPDGVNKRTVKYEAQLSGSELHLKRLAPVSNTPPPELIAHRAPAHEGAYPARLPLPALHRVPDNGLAKTPPMGWNSWNKFANKVDDASVRAMADAMASNGMKDAGYVYINIDDTWEGARDSKGNITTNTKFPNMRALADYVHAKGLKLGIYSSPGPNTCEGYEGSHGHEEQDARTWAAWGIDYLKYDWCGAGNIYTDEEMQPLYQKMGDALRSTGRPIVYSLCQYGRAQVWNWGAQVGGNLWRTTGDISDNWKSMSAIGFAQDTIAPHIRPGHWNDPDMLEVGNGGMSNDEYRTHFSLWSLLAAPLLAGNDLRSMSPETLAILTNKEVIAIDQDPAGHPAAKALALADHEIWRRDLANGDRAIGLFNRSAQPAQVDLDWAKLSLAPPRRLRDLWSHRDLDAAAPQRFTIPPHGVVLLRASSN